MAGETAATAELLAIPGTDAGTLTGSPDGEVWYRLEPAETAEVEILLESGDFNPYADVYRLTGTDPPGEPPWDDLEEWVGWADPRGVVNLLSGEVYYIAVYDMDTFGPITGDFTITTATDFPPAPANDDVVNAQVLDNGTVEITGTTVYASVDFDEYDEGYMSPSVWYKVVIGATGVFTYGIESTTPGYYPRIQIFYATGAVTGFSDLSIDMFNELVGDDGDETPESRAYDQIGTPGVNAGYLAPLEAGDTFYLRVSSSAFPEVSAAQGDFILRVSSPLAEDICLDAADYINPDSVTATVVSGAVRETQPFETFWVPGSEGPWLALLSDLDATLVIPGDDILDGADAGFYYVTIKSKNCTNPGSVAGGFRRNGQPLYPGAYVISTAGGTPVTDTLTLPNGTDIEQETPSSSTADSGFVDSHNMVHYLPVAPGDSIEVVIADMFDLTYQIDLTEICFIRVADASVGPAYALLDVPDFPLGEDGSNLDDIYGQMGEMLGLLDLNVAPTVKGFSMRGRDMCVTDDGVIWVFASVGLDTVSGTTDDVMTGPVLWKWDPASPGWVLIDDDIEGLGTKRSITGANVWPAGVSMDTDGEDLWMAYAIDDGVGPGSIRNTLIRVKKYDVSGASFSNVGSPFTANTTTVFFASTPGSYESGLHLRVSPAGVPWVGFTDNYDAATAREDTLMIGEKRPYVAHWTGSTWDVTLLPEPPNYAPWDPTLIDAKDIRNAGSGTTSEVVIGADTVVRETQTTFAADTMSFTPGAGDWVLSFRYSMTKAAGTGGVEFKMYKNGTQVATFTDAVSSTPAALTSSQWFYIWEKCYFTTDADDVISIRMRRTGNTTEVFCDEVHVNEAAVGIQNAGGGSFGGWWSSYVDGPAHVLVGFPDNREDPVAFYSCVQNPYSPDTDSFAYVAPGALFDSLHLTSPWVYSRWDGSAWDKLWEQFVSFEEEHPELAIVKTLSAPFGEVYNTAAGRWAQGHSLFPDGEGAMYYAASIGIDNGLEFAVLRFTEDGSEAISSRNPGIVGGAGYPGNFSWTQWLWNSHTRGGVVLPSGQLFLGFSMMGVYAEGEECIVTHVPNGIGDWFMASELNNPLGGSASEYDSPAMALSPDGETVYLLADLHLHQRTSGVTTPLLGVWACPVIPDAKTPLIPFEVVAGMINMTWRSAQRAGFVRIPT